MKQPHRILAAATGAALLFAGVLVPPLSLGQSDILPPPNVLAPAAPARTVTPAGTPAVAPAPAQAAAADAAMESLIAEVVAQQAQLVENQKIIDQKLAVIAENLRIARIYVSRAK